MTNAEIPCRLPLLAALLIGSLTLCAPARAASDIERQRALFQTVFETVERGDWSVVDGLSAPDRQMLEQYVLWPDLRASWLRANIKSVDTAKIDAFVQQYGTLKPARELRYRHALQIASDGNLPGYLRIYEQYYQGQNIAKLDCIALQAEIQAGRFQRVDARALHLWTVGKSQVDECDPVFKYLAGRKRLGVTEYRERYLLAIDARNFSLARWLGKEIDQQHVDTAQRWQQAQVDPEDFLRQHLLTRSNETLREQLTYAAEQLTYRDPVIARDLWSSLTSKHRFSDVQRARTARHIALWTARDNLPGAYRLLRTLPPAARDKEVLRWRARVSLRASRWEDLLQDIAAMPETEREFDEWRYWRSVALQRLGQVLAANAILDSLSKERSYYGFLAADELGRNYALDHASLVADEIRLAPLEARPDLIRARELFFVGQDSRGRSEWDAALRTMSAEDKLQAAVLANRWGWHSRAIAAAASSGEYDDLSIRYPLPYQETFEQFASQARISPTWAYGIARSESLFMHDVRSHAGAIGLMQLMPATGRDVAREIKLPFAGLATLVDPESNIRLGTTYLAQMAERFGGNPVLATAAYNAGPHRVDAWLPDTGSIDARVWIENIPFNETRKYVKRVLAAQAIFHWRMTGKVRRLSDELLMVRAVNDTPQVASR
ncbi:MAG TPA: transglycosylase SLT domain-containing protein [Woeseiaceae bacterium]|nr:transglycosylase SLT domain-containing protein [Woeseiaceae bacterium]